MANPHQGRFPTAFNFSAEHWPITFSRMQQLPRAIGTLSLIFILFFCTSGGPYTTETLIHSVGPGLGLLILLVVPVVWSVPEVLIVGELASMLPEEGGYYRWVDRAFGRFKMAGLPGCTRSWIWRSIPCCSINTCATSFWAWMRDW